MRHKTSRRLALSALMALSLLHVGSTPCWADVRIKDITELEGARGNQLIGFGLVVGLDGTGSKNPFTQKVAVDMLQRFNVASKIIAQVQGDNAFKSGNIAAVMVTAELGPFNRRGSRIDVLVSSIDDATSLLGGVLLMTPLHGHDQVDYAVAQGPVLVGGFNFSASGGGQGTAASAQKNHPTVGRVPAGAMVEREARGSILCGGKIRLMLRDPDYQTARAIAKVINARYPSSAVSVDAGSVQVYVPSELCSNVVAFVSEIGVLEVAPDVTAKVVINERTGTIVAGQHVKISAVAVTHGNLAIVTNNVPIPTQPSLFGKSKVQLVPRAELGVTEQGNPVRVVESTLTVADLARALNALGAAPRDLISIFQGLKQAGALHAELVIN